MVQYEMGTTNDPNIIFLNLKGKNDIRFSHFHLNDEDAAQLYKDLELLLNLKKKEVEEFRIDYNTERRY